MHGVRITVLCDECVRVEYAPQGHFCDHPSLFAIHGPCTTIATSPVMNGFCVELKPPSPERNSVIESFPIRSEKFRTHSNARMNFGSRNVSF